MPELESTTTSDLEDKGYTLLKAWIEALSPEDAEAIWLYLDAIDVDTIITLLGDKALSDPRIEARQKRGVGLLCEDEGCPNYGTVHECHTHVEEEEKFKAQE